MKKQIYNYIIIILIIVCIIFLNINTKTNQNSKTNQNTNFRNPCIPFDKNVTICKSNISIYQANNSYQIIERQTLKSILEPYVKYKLMNLDNVFVPSMMYGTFCNRIYTTYYDFKNGHFNSGLLSFINKLEIKRVRIRHYYFDPNSYFEIKYKNHKIRVLIDCQHNILEPIDVEYSELINEIISQIKTGKIPELFYNEYKRFSFIYKNNHSIRMTIDTDIKIKYLEKTHIFPFDILEVKYNINIPKNTILQYFKQIENDTNTKIILSDFSKVDYTIENIIIPYKEKQMLLNIKW